MLRRDRRGAVALMVGVMSPALLYMTAIVIDAGFWMVGQTRLQIGADAGALGASYLLTQPTFKVLTAANQLIALQTVALAEAHGAATKLVGTITTPASVSYTATSVTVTLTSRLPNMFFGPTTLPAPLIRAVATATLNTAQACVVTLGTTGTDITVDNAGSLAATNCPIASDSTANPSIYLNSGSITATAVVAAGTIVQSNSGSNTLVPSPGTQNAGATADPVGLTTPTAPGTCNATNGSYTSSDPNTKIFTPTGSPPTYTFCGNTSFQGNGAAATFNPGTYFFTGDLTFANQDLAAATGVSFILTGTYAGSSGSFSWTDYSGTFAMTPATTGPAAAAKIGIWQGCNNSGSQTTTFNGGSTLSISGFLYAPCSDLTANNNAKLTANGSFSVVAKTLHVSGSAAISTAPGSSGSASAAAAVLTQ